MTTNENLTAKRIAPSEYSVKVRRPELGQVFTWINNSDTVLGHLSVVSEPTHVSFGQYWARVREDDGNEFGCWFAVAR